MEKFYFVCFLVNYPVWTDAENPFAGYIQTQAPPVKLLLIKVAFARPKCNGVHYTHCLCFPF